MTTVLLTGATGFVGSRLRPVLERRGLRVRCLSRDAARAEGRFPGSEWLQADLADPVAMRKAMQGCDAAYYLVHEMGSGGDYREREAAAARIFAHAAADAGLAVHLSRWCRSRHGAGVRTSPEPRTGGRDPQRRRGARGPGPGRACRGNPTTR